MPMTYPSYRHLLMRLSDEKMSERGRNSVFAIGAFLGLLPVGLTLALADASLDIDILSIYAARQFRGNGMAAAMLKELVLEARGRIGKMRGHQLVRSGSAGEDPGSFRIRAIYEKEHHFSQAVERILDSQGFEPSTPRCTVFRCDSEMGQMPWLDMYFDVSEPFRIIPWIEVDPGEIELVRTGNGEAGEFPQELSPFSETDRIEPSNSMALLRSGKIVGWSITHRPMPDTIRYSSIFVAADIRGLGLAIPLLMESIRRHVRTEMAVQAPKATFVVYHTNPEMKRMVSRRMARYSKEITESVERILSIAINCILSLLL